MKNIAKLMMTALGLATEEGSYMELLQNGRQLLVCFGMKDMTWHC
jgi:hypothetical protein